MAANTNNNLIYWTRQRQHDREEAELAVREASRYGQQRQPVQYDELGPEEDEPTEA